MRWLRSNWGVALILGVGYAAFLIYAYPGYMSIDSAVHLSEGRAGHYTDWHPPLVAWLWHIVDWVIKGPLGMLLLQSIAFLAGLYRWMRRAYQPTAAAALAVAVLLFPPVLAPMAVVWKDCQMAAYLVLGFTLVLSERRWARVFGFLLVTLGCGMRDNSPSTTLPFLVIAFTWKPAPKWFVRVGAAVAIWIVMSTAAIGFNKAMTDQREHAWHTAVATHDIIGTLRFTSREYSDQELDAILAGTPLIVHANIQRSAHAIYTPVSWWSMLNNDRRMFDWPSTPEHRAALERAWKQIVAENPRAYLVHRWRVFREVLGLTPHPQPAPMWNGVPSDDYITALHIEYTPTSVQVAIGRALMWLAQTHLFRPYIYFALALCFLPLARRHRDVLGLLASGLVYEFSFFPFGGGDVRYSHYMTITVLVAGLILFRRRYGERSPALDTR